MPKYYIKINNDKTIIDRKNINLAITDAIKISKTKYSKDTTVYISEQGFDGYKWTILNINNYLSQIRDYDVN